MDFGIDTLIYIIIGVIFVLAQAARKRKAVKGKPPEAAPVDVVNEEKREELSDFWKEFLGTDLTANQVPEPVRIQPVPTVYAEPGYPKRVEPVEKEPVFPKSSFNDPGDPAGAGLNLPAEPTDDDHSYSAFDLRSAVVYSVILERKYV